MLYYLGRNEINEMFNEVVMICFVSLLNNARHPPLSYLILDGSDLFFCCLSINMVIHDFFSDIQIPIYLYHLYVFVILFMYCVTTIVITWVIAIISCYLFLCYNVLVPI